MMQTVNTQNADRKLYIGNLPANITQENLVVLLNAALKKLNINTQVPGDSITASWIN